MSHEYPTAGVEVSINRHILTVSSKEWIRLTLLFRLLQVVPQLLLLILLFPLLFYGLQVTQKSLDLLILQLLNHVLYSNTHSHYIGNSDSPSWP